MLPRDADVCQGRPGRWFAAVAREHHTVLYLVLTGLKHFKEGVNADEAPLAFFGGERPCRGYAAVAVWGAVPEPVAVFAREFVVRFVYGEAPL